MHPKQIIADIQSMGSRLVLDGDDLYVENPENIYPEIEEVIKSYKLRIVQYLKGEYSNREHGITQTIDKIIDFYRGIDQTGNSKINAWLNQDYESVDNIMTLFILFSNNGWTVKEPIDEYRDIATDDLSQEIFDKAMAFFKGG